MRDVHDLAKSYYDAARAEVIQRLAMREQVLLAGLTAFGVIGGLALSSLGRQSLLSLFPLLSFAFVVLLFRHQFLMAQLGEYIRTELESDLKLCDSREPGGRLPLHWDNWLRNEDSAKRLRFILAMELLGAWLLLWLPGLLALLVIFHRVSRAIIYIDGALMVVALVPFLAEMKRLVHEKTILKR
jgi:hypothetical protein